ncbi:DNA damage checkpoint antagonist DdcA [Lentibacillus halophilus]|uniref:DNA damage checkpoint antagonist DdcA n=1 Tax=Lentibacillus halophilus TaxID=295065 RepID=A0ABN0ZBQ0_9BACI
MAENSENVILFPKWRATLEEESLQALKETRFDEALVKLNQLLDYGVRDHEIMIGRLICLMELNRYHEAQDFCEELLLAPDEHYYQYVHMYLTVLFHTSQYQLLMEQIEKELASHTIPKEMEDPFTQLYDMSRNLQKQLRVEKSSEYIDELLRSVNEQDHRKQYRLIEYMRTIKTNPTQDLLSLLRDDQVHPVVKTALLIWYEEQEINDKMMIHKLGVQMEVNPSELTPLDSHPVLKQTRLIIGDLEQENPSLHTLIDELMYHYFYVRYPIIPGVAHVEHIAQALINIGEDCLNIHMRKTTEGNQLITTYMEDINMCKALYATIMDA